MRRLLTAAAAAALFTAVLPLSAATATTASTAATTATACANEQRIDVPGAELQQTACLEDLTTYGLLDGNYDARTSAANGRYTDITDFAGLHAAGTVNPRGVPGVQVDGYFPDSSTTNATHGWNHDSQFVIRLPDQWNGKLVVTGAPGVRRQYSHDFLVSDWVLAQGYAYASIDKGNTGALFFKDGAQPGDAVREWHTRVTQVTRAAQAVVQQAYGTSALRTYMTGVSNGGYLTRWQLENRPELYDGGVDWEGTLFEADNNLLTYLPPALRAYPAYRDSPVGSPAREAARQQLLAAGFAPGSEFLWDLHYRVYWDLTQRIYREELDPAADGALEAGITETCTITTQGCSTVDVAYDLRQRADAQRALRGITLSGRIGKPMLSLHGTLDTLLPISLHGDRYAQLVTQQRRGGLHRYYVVDRGQHVDGFFGATSEPIRPILPCFRSAFEALVGWVEHREQPPASGPVQPARGDVRDDCRL